jgi:hypothetical protein
MIHGSAAIHPYHLGLLMLWEWHFECGSGISITCHFGRAKYCVINAVDTNYLLSGDEVMANILHLAQNMQEELPGTDMIAPAGHAPPPDLCMCHSWLWFTR